MNIAATISYQGPSFNQKCSFCGSKYNIETTKQDGHNEREEYYCPECHKEETVRASNSPRITLLEPRTDGRITNYYEE